VSRVKRVLKGTFVVFFLALLLTDLLISGRGFSFGSPLAAVEVPPGVFVNSKHSPPSVAKTLGMGQGDSSLLARADNSPEVIEDSGGQSDDSVDSPGGLLYAKEENIGPRDAPTVDYPSGLQYGEEDIPDQEFPLETEDGEPSPFNPFDLSGEEDGPSDENTDGDQGNWWNPFDIGKNLSNKISQWVWTAINNFLIKSVRQAFKHVLGFVAKEVFQPIDFTSEPAITNIYRGISYMAGGILVLLIVAIGLKLMAGSSMGSNDIRAKAALPRIIKAAFMAIFALPLCQLMVTSAHYASVQIMGFLNVESLDTVGSPVSTIWQLLCLDPRAVGGIYMMVLIVFLLLGFVFLAIFYVIRRGALMVMVLLAPIAFVLGVDDSTSNYTTLWFKSFVALCFVEVVHAITIVLMFSVLLQRGRDSGLVIDNIVYSFALLYLFYKIPQVLFASTVINWGPRAKGTVTPVVSGAPGAA